MFCRFRILLQNSNQASSFGATFVFIELVLFPFGGLVRKIEAGGSLNKRLISHFYHDIERYSLRREINAPKWVMNSNGWCH